MECQKTGSLVQLLAGNPVHVSICGLMYVIAPSASVT
jgi:hypothetical protein